MSTEFKRLQKLAGLLKEDSMPSRMEFLNNSLDQNAWKEATSKLEGIVEFYQNEGFENDEIVEGLPTRAVIYKTESIKNLKFDDNLGIYGYLEDLDFSLQLKKRGKLMVCSKAKYTHDQSIDRSGFKFGKKEVRNRYYLVQKHNLNKFLFFITLFAKILFNLKEGIFFNKNSLQRFYGNIVALMSLNKLEK
jgi:GT2 family glycosyltransferase